MRQAKIERKTLETEVIIELNLDGTGQRTITTGIKFFDHMLEQLAAHSCFDIKIRATSHDSDPHHIIEDVGISIGNAINQALGDRKGIKRYGQMLLPMDESLALVAVDLSGRPYSNVIAEIEEQKVNDFDTILLKHFFRSLSTGALLTTHITLMYGEDPHHKIEAIFKSFARALGQACTINKENASQIPSTKGVL